MKQVLLPMIGIAGRQIAEAREGLTHLTCTEISGLVDLLIVAGELEYAAAVVLGHGYGDDDDSYTHHKIYRAERSGKDASKAAKKWVAKRALVLP